MSRAITAVGVLLVGGLALAQPAPPSELFSIQAQSAATWNEGESHVIQLEGPVSIELEQAKLSSRQAVIWLTPAGAGRQQAEIALVGEARLEQSNIVRSGGQLFVSLSVRGTVQLTAEQRLGRNLGDSELYKTAASLRAAHGPGFGRPIEQPWLVERPWITAGTTQPAPATPAAVRRAAPVRMQFGRLESTRSDDGKVALVLSEGVLLLQQRPGGDLITLQADRAVVFTDLVKLTDLPQAEGKSLQTTVQAAYLEGDVRIVQAPGRPNAVEQRLEANRVYYEFPSDRAILTDAVVHGTEPLRQIPIVVRAAKVRQLGMGEYNAEKVELTTSAFATPSYSINAGRAYVRTSDASEGGQRVTFSAGDTTARAFGVPFFYFPAMGASVTDRGLPIRSAGLVNSSRLGFGATSEWGLFETLGAPAPRDLDASFRADYFSDRGPATGLGGKYNGGLVTATTKDPWNFTGAFDSYLIYDHGEDDLGRAVVDPHQKWRGQFLWEHQHFFPGDWQVQLRAGTSSDATFLEEWFPNDFYNGPERDYSLYVKRQRDLDAATFLVNYQPADFVTSSEYVQEQFEVEHLPEIGYHRIGDSWADDSLTFFSDNKLSALHYSRSKTPLARQGFVNGVSPGIPSVGTTGTTADVIYRGYSRQEVDYPLNAGPFKFVPYVMGFYAPYSDSPADGGQQRLYGGAGVRLTTAFWKVDDSARSELLDIHRLRHVVEPEVHAFTSGQTVDRNDLFLYEESIDKTNDVSALQLALRQRWQTKRGGPGRWRSVDFLTWNLEMNLFANQPTRQELDPYGFRGLFFSSLPEASIPRNSVNSDASWRITDTTALLADAQYNLDTGELATGAVGLAVRRDPRLAYYVGTRYIEPLNSAITTVAADYELSRKYILSLSQSFDFGQEGTVASNVTLIRRFDRFFLALRFYYDARTNQDGFSINILPEGLGPLGGQIPTMFAR